MCHSKFFMRMIGARCDPSARMQPILPISWLRNREPRIDSQCPPRNGIGRILVGLCRPSGVRSGPICDLSRDAASQSIGTCRRLLGHFNQMAPRRSSKGVKIAGDSERDLTLGELTASSLSELLKPTIHATACSSRTSPALDATKQSKQGGDG